jgi:hypothetical protein
MGRPLNKRYFGPPTAGGDEIKVQFHNGTGSVNGWIVKQLGSKKFRCTDGTATEDCFLVDKASAAVAAGEMTITVKDDGGTARQVTKIAGRKVTLDTGTSIAWNFSDATDDGAVEMEEAGSTAIAAVALAGITLTSAQVVEVETAAVHGLTTGDTVNFADIVGTTELNTGLWTVTVVDTTNFTIDGTDGDDFTAYVSDGTVQETTEDDFEGDA